MKELVLIRQSIQFRALRCIERPCILFQSPDDVGCNSCRSVCRLRPDKGRAPGISDKLLLSVFGRYYKPFELLRLALDRLGHELLDPKNLLGTGRKAITFAQTAFTATLAFAVYAVFLRDALTARLPDVIVPPLVLAASCLLVSCLATGLLPVVGRAVRHNVGGIAAEHAAALLSQVGTSFSLLAVVGAILLALVAGLAVLRQCLLQGRPVTQVETWGCGYAQPTPRMQYTASSFSQPVTEVFHPLLQDRLDQPALTAYFPDETRLHTDAPEPWRELVFRPLFAAFGWLFAKLRWLQHGRAQLYILYIALTALILLVWYLR